MKVFKTTGIMVFLTTMLFSTTLMAKPGHKGMDPQKRLEFMQKNLDLSSEQTAKIKAIGEKYEPQRKQSRSQIKKMHQELRDLLMSENPSRTAVKAKMEQISKLQIETRLTGFDQRMEVAAILTSEQKTKMRELMKKRMQKNKKRRDRD